MRRVALPALVVLGAAGAVAPGGRGAATVPAAGGAAPAPRVQQMVAFRDGHALAKRVSSAAASIRVGGRRCAVAARTPLAVLAHSRSGRLRFRDFGACSSRPSDATGILVIGIGPDRNHGQRGWVYKVGHRAATAGAGDPGGPFGRGRLRARQRVTWFYCLRAESCQRTLDLRATPIAGGVVATVTGYDDAGHGVRIEGATVSAGSVTGTTGADGRAQLSLPRGAHRLVARKDGLVRSFTERVEVP